MNNTLMVSFALFAFTLCIENVFCFYNYISHNPLVSE